MIDLPSRLAWQQLQTNPAGRWSNGLQRDPEEGTAWERITSSDFFQPHLTASFSILPSDRVFAIGSCFARHVEVALRDLGIQVDSLTTIFDDIPVAVGGKNTPIGFANKYNPPSILNELRWAMEPGTGLPRKAITPADDGLCSDPHCSPVFGYADEETTMQRHALLTDLMRNVADAKVLVITLGLIEAFYDTYTGLYTNYTPRFEMAESGRFRFRVLSYGQIMESLEAIHALLARRAQPDLQIVVTVSPVPLEATFTTDDIVVANARSKALLRVTAGEWADLHSNVTYFPSYEVVTTSDRASAWERDGRHVRYELVKHVMNRFVEAYVQARPAASRQATG